MPICDAVLGDGHFLGSQQTYAAMERDYFYPQLADRNEPRTWAQEGARTAWDVAADRVADILDVPDAPYLSDA